MRAHVGCLSTTACLIVLVGLNGCAGPRETRFYVLTPLPAAERPRDASPGRNPAIGLRPVSLPEQLDRPQIVTRVGENMLQLAEFDQWAAPLRDNFTRVLAGNLSVLVPTERVNLFPWGKDTAIDYEIAVEVAQFEGVLGGECSLLAHWTVLRRGGRTAPTTGTSIHREPAGHSYATLVAAHTRLVAALSRDIATALKASQQ
jgi:uncharacterized lipoprotein YmbA